MILILKELWNYLKYMLTLDEKYLFEPEPPDNRGFVIACKELVPRVKAVPYIHTGMVDNEGNETLLSTVYTCENCNHPLEIMDDVIKRPLGNEVTVAASDVILGKIPYGHPTIYNVCDGEIKG